MHIYIARSGGRYVVYQGKDDARKHPESKELWFYVPQCLFGDNGFNKAFYTAKEAEDSLEEFDESYQEISKQLDEIRRQRQVKERRSQLRLIKSV